MKIVNIRKNVLNNSTYLLFLIFVYNNCCCIPSTSAYTVFGKFYPSRIGYHVSDSGLREITILCFVCCRLLHPESIFRERGGRTAVPTKGWLTVSRGHVPVSTTESLILCVYTRVNPVLSGWVCEGVWLGRVTETWRT